MTFLQRFGSAINLNPHLHVLMLDGVYVKGEVPRFVAGSRLRDSDVRQIVETTARRIVRLLQRRGLLEEDADDPLWEKEPLLASITAASLRGHLAVGARAGQRIRRRLIDPDRGVHTGPLCFAARGFSLHVIAAAWNGCAAT